jgi:hypothetical protein
MTHLTLTSTGVTVLRYLCVLLIFAYTLAIPLALISVFYIDIAEAIAPCVAAIGIPFIILIIHAVAEREENHSVQQSVRYKVAAVVCNVLGRASYATYQLAVTLLSCVTYIYYTYYLSFEINYFDEYQYTTSMPSTTLFVQIEYFIIVSMGIDYFIQFVMTDSPWEHVKKLHNIINLACFTGVAYFSLFHLDLLPTAGSNYNFYLLQAFLRFLRTRWSVAKLLPLIMDKCEQGNSSLSQGHRITSIMLIFGFLLYIMSGTALVLAVEFPCEALEDPAVCCTALQKFHNAMYYMVGAAFTAGSQYYVATIFGKFLFMVLMAAMITQVSIIISHFSDTFYHRVPREPKATKAVSDSSAHV